MKLREVEECVPGRQLDFLRRSDERSKRLWFLWEKGEGGTRHSSVEETVRCGCYGGCLFYDACVERPLPQEKSDSAVYATPFPDLPSPEEGSVAASFSKKPLGLQTLRRSLQSQSMKDVACVVSLHEGTLEHYMIRYRTPSTSPEKKTPLQEDVEEKRRSLDTTESSDVNSEVFLTPHASLTSLVDETYHSLEDLSVSGAAVSQQIAEGKRLKHKKKPSSLSYEYRLSGVPSTEGVDNGTYDSSTSESDYFQDLVPSHSCVPLVLHVPLKQAPRLRVSGASATSTPSHRFSGGLLSSDATYLRSASVPSGSTSRQGTVKRHPRDLQNSLKLRLPILVQSSNSHLPAVVRRDAVKVGVLRKRSRHDSDGGELEEGKLAKVSLSLLAREDVTVMASPPLLSFVRR